MVLAQGLLDGAQDGATTEVEAMKLTAPVRRILLAILALAFVSTTAVAQQKFPNGTVRIVAPYVAGGAVDIAARSLADLLSERCGSRR